MADNNPHKDHRKRVRKQFLADGFTDSTPEHKILELLLFYSIPRKDTNEIAHALLNRFGSITAILDASPQEIMRVDGISENSAVLIKLLTVFCRQYEKGRKAKGMVPKTYDEIFDFLAPKYYGLTRETFGLTTLNNKNELIAFDILNVGDIDSVNLSVRSVVEKALERRAKYVVISHNHPNGNAVPSPSDIEMTKKVKLAFSHLDIPLLDHIIFDNNDGISMAQSIDYKHLF